MALLEKYTKSASLDNENKLESIVVARATTEEKLIKALEDALREYCFAVEYEASRPLITEEELKILQG